MDRPLPERQGGQPQRGGGGRALRELEEKASAEAVGRLAGRQGQQQHGQELGQAGEPERGRRVGALVQLPADGDGLDLAADAGQHAAGQQQAVVAAAEGRVGVVDFRHGLLGGPSSPLAGGGVGGGGVKGKGGLQGAGGSGG